MRFRSRRLESLRTGVLPRGVGEQRLHDLEPGNVGSPVHVREDGGVAEQFFDSEVQHHAVSAVQLDRMLGDVRKILNKFPGDMRVEERATGMVASVIPIMGRMCDQLTDQQNKIFDQMRRLPSYQINWPAVPEIMRDLQEEFMKLRRITSKCMQLVNNEEHRRIIKDLAAHIDRKIDLCHSMGG